MKRPQESAPKGARAALSAEARAKKKAAQRARHWRRTGVSEATIRWMADRGML